MRLRRGICVATKLNCRIPSNGPFMVSISRKREYWAHRPHAHAVGVVMAQVVNGDVQPVAVACASARTLEYKA